MAYEDILGRLDNSSPSRDIIPDIPVSNGAYADILEKLHDPDLPNFPPPYGAERSSGLPWEGYYYSAYGIAVKHGYIGTEEEWLRSLKGERGDNVQLRYNSETNYLEQKAESDTEWSGVMSLTQLQTELEQATIEEVNEARDDAQSYAAAAGSSAAAAASSASAATASEANAQSYAAAAESSANNAEEFATAAAVSAQDAAASESAASGYASAAGSSAAAAAGSASAAAGSASAATAASSAASVSASAAQQAAENAHIDAIDADASAGEAAESAQAAETAKDAAQNAATTATQQATAAATSASDAATSAQNASESATSAAGSASDAAESAADALAYLTEFTTPTADAESVAYDQQVDASYANGNFHFKLRTGEKGDDGFSPEVTTAPIIGGHRVTITDAEGTHTFDVLDGTGAGDMLSTTYDPDAVVAGAGGIAEYVEENGGKIDTIKVNGTAQTITDKAVDITVPTTAADVSADPVGSASAVQTNLNTHISDAVKHITAAERSAWNAKQDAIPDNTYDAYGAAAGVQTNLDAVTAKISSAASSTNQLVSASEMGDAIEAVEAKQLYATASQGSFATKAALTSATTFYNADGTVATPTKNDVAYVLADESHDEKSAKYVIASVDPIIWGFVITFSDATFSQAQMNAINSGITSGNVSSYDSHVSSTSNPHSVTKAQVGLGNVDNKSEATIKSDFTGSIASENNGFVTGGAAYTALSGKQDTISDLVTIRSGAAAGATAVQPETGKGLFSGNYNDLSNKPTIPTQLSQLSGDATHRVVTDTEKSTWNGKGTYSKPSGGIPKTDLATAVQTSLGKADSALQSHQSLAAYRTAAAQDIIDAGKVSVQQGAAQAGKFLVVGSDGNITLQSLEVYDGSVV